MSMVLTFFVLEVEAVWAGMWWLSPATPGLFLALGTLLPDLWC